MSSLTCLTSPCVTPEWKREWKHMEAFKGVLHLWALFLKTLCIFSQNKATSDKVFYGSGQKCSKELKNHSFNSVETIVVKLQWKMCENQYFPCFEPQINNHLSLWNSKAIIRFPEMLPIRNISYLLPMCCSFWEKYKNSPKTGLGCSTPLKRDRSCKLYPTLRMNATSYRTSK